MQVLLWLHWQGNKPQAEGFNSQFPDFWLHVEEPLSETPGTLNALNLTAC